MGNFLLELIKLDSIFDEAGGGLKEHPVHGGAKQRMIKHRLCQHYDWTQNPGHSNIETFPCMGGLAPPLALEKPSWGLAPDKLHRWARCNLL